MAVTDWKSPGTVDSYNLEGNFEWSNPENAISSDDNYTSASNGGPAGLPSEYLRAKNFGFSLPADSTIVGIEAKVEHRSGNDTAEDVEVFLVTPSSTWSENKASATTWGHTIPDEVFTYGGAEDLWNLSPSPSDVNSSDFSFLILTLVLAFSTNQIDHIQIRVYYTESTTPTVGVKYPLPAFKR